MATTRHFCTQHLGFWDRGPRIFARCVCGWRSENFRTLKTVDRHIAKHYENVQREKVTFSPMKMWREMEEANRVENARLDAIVRDVKTKFCKEGIRLDEEHAR